MKHLEIACFDLESAIIADKAGVDRIELCEGLAEGGITPRWEMVMEARELIETEIYVMVRPRGGDFCYNDEEFEQMKNDIVAFKRAGVYGFVFGVLTKDNEIDVARNKDLLDLAYPFPCTFHRAFDRVKDIFTSLEIIIACGFSTVLTSGAEDNAMAGLHNLKTLVAQAANRIVVMPGGGVRSSNIAQISNLSQAHFYHSSAIVDETLLANANEIKDLKSHLK